MSQKKLLLFYRWLSQVFYHSNREVTGIKFRFSSRFSHCIHALINDAQREHLQADKHQPRGTSRAPPPFPLAPTSYWQPRTQGITHIESQQRPIWIAAPGPPAQVFMRCVEQHEGGREHGHLRHPWKSQTNRQSVRTTTARGLHPGLFFRDFLCPWPQTFSLLFLSSKYLTGFGRQSMLIKSQLKPYRKYKWILHSQNKTRQDCPSPWEPILASAAYHSKHLSVLFKEKDKLQ